jgi:hypothetical protein
MTGERDQDLRPPKRLILRAALRSLLIAAVLVVCRWLPADPIGPGRVGWPWQPAIWTDPLGAALRVVNRFST